MKNEFDEMCAALAHQQEIASSRVGCLGSSDAAMVLKVAQKGIDALSNTDIKRLRVMLGLEKREDFGGNAYTNAGHLFEDYAESALDEPTKEYRLEDAELNGIFKHFKVIAHADFFEPTRGRVCECKFVQKPTEKVLQQYQAQLQWYYLFPEVKDVALLHGTGNAEPFEVHSFQAVRVDLNEDIFTSLHQGLAAIDAYCETLLKDAGEWRDEDWGVEILDALMKYRIAKSMADIHAKEMEEARVQILEYMEKNHISSTGCTGVKVTYKKPTIQRRFDAAKAQELFPELRADERVWKTSEIRASVTIKLD